MYGMSPGGSWTAHCDQISCLQWSEWMRTLNSMGKTYNGLTSVQAKPNFTSQVPNFFVCKTKFYLTPPSYGLTNMSVESKLKYLYHVLDIDLVLPTWIKRAWISLHFYKHFLSVNKFFSPSCFTAFKTSCMKIYPLILMGMGRRMGIKKILLVVNYEHKSQQPWNVFLGGEKRWNDIKYIVKTKSSLLQHELKITYKVLKMFSNEFLKMWFQELWNFCFVIKRAWCHMVVIPLWEV